MITMGPDTSRRQFIAGLMKGGGAIFCGIAGCTGPSRRRETGDLRGLPQGLKISCSSLGFADMKWDEALEAMRDLGFRHADLAMFEGWVHINPSELVEPEEHGKAVRATCSRLGIEPIALHGNFAGGLTNPDAEVRRRILTHFERVARCAETAGIPLVNVQPGAFLKDRTREECIANAVETLRGMLRITMDRKLILTFENHAGSIGEQPGDALRILEGVPGLRLDYDPSHVVCSSIPLERTLPLLRYVAHVGIRNARPGSYNEPIRGDSLDYDLGAFLAAFRRAGVNAFVSVEYYEPRMRENIPKLKSILEGHGLPA